MGNIGADGFKCPGGTVTILSMTMMESSSCSGDGLCVTSVAGIRLGIAWAS